MRSIIPLSQALGLALLLGACAGNTQVVDSWKEPGLQPQRFNKVLAVFIAKDPSMRRAAEDELARKLTNVVPSYSVLPDSVAGDRNKARSWIQNEKFDAVVIMRPVKVDKEQTYVPGTTYVAPASYGSMWGYWGTGWGYAYDPGYVREDEVVHLEANVYSVSDAKLIWASRTKTYNPDSVRDLVDEIVDATAAEMKRQKVVG
jgi:hypothetical protein